MKKESVARITKTGVALLVCAAVACLIAYSQGFSFGAAAYLNARCLSDGAFVVGIVAAGFGALTLVSTTGFFDMLSYGFRSLVVLFTSLKNPKDHVAFYDYKTQRAERRQKPSYFLLIIGLCFIALSAAFLALYYHLMPAA